MDIFDFPHKPRVATKKPLSSRGGGFGAEGRDKSNVPIGSHASAWRGWKAREAGDGMEMDVNPVETSGKQKGRVKVSHSISWQTTQMSIWLVWVGGTM